MTGRRQITIVIEPTGEINRAWSRDEVVNADASIGYTPNVNVTEETLAGLLPTEAKLIAQIAALTDAKADAEQRAKEAERRAEEVEAECSAKVAEAASDRDAKVQAAAAKAAELEAQIASMTAVPDRSIHKAYLRAALASIERLAEVDAAVQSAGAVKWELWANATTIAQDDADVNAIADALGIDLDAVFTAARAIRAARGG